MTKLVSQKIENANQIQKHSELDLRIEDLAYGGQGLGRIDGYVIFAGGTVPGDLARVRIVKRKKSHAEAELVRIVEPSPDRVEPVCPLFGQCGGCSGQNMSYALQLRHKQRQAESVFEHLGKVKPERILPIIGSPLEYRYRNKMDFTFGTNDEGQPIIGFHRPKQFSHILEVRRCYLQPEPVDRLLEAMRTWVRAKGLTSYNPFTHKGFLRHLIIRHSVDSGGIVAVLLTGRGQLPDAEELVSVLREACPELQAFVWGLNEGWADIARQDREEWHWGEPLLIEKLSGLKFRVSPMSFFQVNTRAAELLYGAVRDFLGEEAASMRLLDAYCGTGTIGLFCADRAREIVGIELIRDAIWDARLNARENGIENCLFLAGSMRDRLPLAAETGPFGRVIMDPPRGGMDKRSLKGLLELQAPVLIYVSCNPATLARDVVTICEAGYRVSVMQPVDLFPQTFHIETVVRFDRDDQVRPDFSAFENLEEPEGAPEGETGTV